MKKTKYKSAAHKKAAIEADRYQKEMYKRWGIEHNAKRRSDRDFTGNYTHRSSDVSVSCVPVSGGICSRKQSPEYTGDLVTGIVVQHKSCLQPIINKQQAIESATMRRN